MTVKFIAPRVAITDPRTGLMSREWYRFFGDFFTATANGGADSASAIFQSGILDGQQQGTNELAARVAELEKGLDSLRKGGVVL